MELNLAGRGYFSRVFSPALWGVAIAASTFGINLPAQAQSLAFQGTTSGQWGMPSNPSSSTFISGENGSINNRLTWGSLDGCSNCTSFTNYVQYDGLGFQAGVNDTFQLGNLSYQNGSTLDGFDGNFPLGIALNFANPALGSQNFSFLFNIFNSPNVTGDPIVDGDRLRFSNSGISSQTFTLGNQLYNLRLIGFSSDGGNTLLSEFNSPEGTIAYASLYGQIQAIDSSPPPPSPIPSPDPIVISPIDPPVESPIESPPEVPETQSILAMIIGIGFLAIARRYSQRHFS